MNSKMSLGLEWTPRCPLELECTPRCPLGLEWTPRCPLGLEGSIICNHSDCANKSGFLDRKSLRILKDKFWQNCCKGIFLQGPVAFFIHNAGLFL